MGAHMAEDGDNVIHYAPPAARPRRRLRLWHVVALLILVAAGASLWWWPPAWRRGQLLYWQQQCNTYSPPPEQVVYAYDWPTGPVAPVPGFLPVPEPWRRYYELVSPPGFKSRATLFLHRRVSPGGAERLVAVDLIDVVVLGRLNGGPEATALWLSARSFKPARPHAAPVEWVGTVSLVINSRHGGGFQFYAGQSDRDDPSHFTIAYRTAGGETGAVDGWLRDDGSVVLELREPPASAASDASPPLTPSAPPSPGRSP